jgi:hypothetical protein
MFPLGVRSCYIVVSLRHWKHPLTVHHETSIRNILPFHFSSFTWPVLSEHKRAKLEDLGYYQQPFRDLFFGSTPGFFGRGMALSVD